MVQLDQWGMSELGLNGTGSAAPGSGGAGGGQYQSHGLYGSGLAMGSLQNLARSGGRSAPGAGAGGVSGLGGLQGRLTPSMGGLGQNMSLLQSSQTPANSRNPLFSRKMGDGSIGSGPNHGFFTSREAARSREGVACCFSEDLCQKRDFFPFLVHCSFIIGVVF